MLVGKFTPGEAQLCTEQGLVRRLNRVFEYQGLSYLERTKASTVLQGAREGSPAVDAGEEVAGGPSMKRKQHERSPQGGQTKKALALQKRPREAALDVAHAETSPEGFAASRDVPRRETLEGTQEARPPKSLFCSRVDLPTLILSDDEEFDRDRNNP